LGSFHRNSDSGQRRFFDDPELSLELGEKTGRLDEKNHLLEERTEELKRLRAENVELLKYRARYHVLQGRMGWPGENDN
jgi:hypothetical protein